ncbi:hypothetical protein C453_13206 [Haloferax elongans ATCC BAA-1513]|uniref:Lipoprotein n=1 Tax=Haloferax elongans ATCC BAA-1513 TaxID=1230453 RepID=M0HIR2_HALEO|nr:hypothetical protein [Haloferax elongans]ELZ82969.1 hypothetical protein C453_13206 [Haloferax elongans ATCC BAA-1513]
MTTHSTRRRFLVAAGVGGATLLAGCTGTTDGGSGGDGDDTMADETTMEPTTEMDSGDGMATDPMSAPRATIDRFSEAAGTLMVRTDENGLPGPDEAIDFDQGPFITQGLGPDGSVVRYYNFDVQTTTPAPIYVLFREGEDTPVSGQLNVIDAIPGDEGYNDFWQVHKVTVPDEYVANTVTSLADIGDAGYETEATEMLVNCPVVPDGSTASMRYDDGDAGLVEGWYKGEVVSYFQFTEAPLSVSDGSVPLSPIYVAFNVNPGEDGGGPASGFMTEEGSDQTHNVVATVPGDQGYSPLWFVNIYDNAEFGSVSDLDSATDAEQLASGAATVNCPVVSVE